MTDRHTAPREHLVGMAVLNLNSRCSLLMSAEGRERLVPLVNGHGTSMTSSVSPDQCGQQSCHTKKSIGQLAFVRWHMYFVDGRSCIVTFDSRSTNSIAECAAHARSGTCVTPSRICVSFGEDRLTWRPLLDRTRFTPMRTMPPPPAARPFRLQTLAGSSKRSMKLVDASSFEY